MKDTVKEVASAVTTATTSDEHAFFIFLFASMKFLPRLKPASYKKLIDNSALKQSSVKRVQYDSKFAKLKMDARDKNNDVQIPVQLYTSRNGTLLNTENLYKVDINAKVKPVGPTATPDSTPNKKSAKKGLIADS